MSDLLSVLSTAYKSAPLPSPGNYVNVDPTKYQGTWSGSYPPKTKGPLAENFTLSVTDVQGFRAQVKFQVANGPIQSVSVLIKNSAFKIGDTKFSLSSNKDTLSVNTIITNPVTQDQSLVTTTATRPSTAPSTSSSTANNPFVIGSSTPSTTSTSSNSPFIITA
jgi:hypothetical protein